jgi:hypothetical protein
MSFLVKFRRTVKIENRPNWQFEEEIFSTNGCFRLHISLRTNEILIHNSVYVFDNWGKN